MRIATYSRISTDEEHQPHSLGAQADRLAAYCASQDGWHIVHRYEDQMTGTVLERPGLQHALTSARAGRFDLLLVFRVDRLARSVRALAQILHDLDEFGVAFRSATEPFDTTSPAGRMMVQMLGVFAEFERATIIERISAGMERKARQGGWVPGTPPIGYRIVAESGFLEALPEQADLVQRIFRLYTEQRLGTRALANQLNDQGARSARGKLWSATAVQAVLTNPVYIGQIRWRDDTYQAPHQPLVARDVFDEAQTLLAARAANYSRRRSNSSDYLLSGKLRCGHCDAAMVGSAAHGRNRRYRYYTCFNRHRYGKTNGCNADRIPADALEQHLLSLLADTLGDTAVLAQAVTRAAELADSNRPNRERELRTLERELGKLVDTRDRYLTAFERGSLPEDTCGTRLRTLQDQADQLEARRNELTDALAAAEPAQIDHHAIATLRALLTHGLPDTEPSERKHILGQLIETIEIRGRDWIKPTLRIPTVRIVGDEVELNGALSNPQQAKTMRELGAVCAQLVKSGTRRPEPSRTLPRRLGRISNGVLKVLETAEAPMRAAQIHADVERALGEPVRFGSVKQVLSVQTKRQTGWAIRVDRGRYVLRPGGRSDARR